MLLLTSAPTSPSWWQVLASPDERVLWAILAVAVVAVLAGLWLRRSKRREPALAPPETFG